MSVEPEATEAAPKERGVCFHKKPLIMTSHCSLSIYGPVTYYDHDSETKKCVKKTEHCIPRWFNEMFETMEACQKKCGGGTESDQVMEPALGTNSTEASQVKPVGLCNHLIMSGECRNNTSGLVTYYAHDMVTTQCIERVNPCDNIEALFETKEACVRKCKPHCHIHFDE